MANCKSLKPAICGKRSLDMPQDGCDSVRFSGLTDLTVGQCGSLDLAEGVHAYDGRGNEIPFTYEPSEIDLSKAGEYTVTYTAEGTGDKRLPTFPCIRTTFLYVTDFCSLERVKAERKIIVEEGEGILPITCKALACCAVVDCSPTLPATDQGTTCSAKLIC